MAKESKNHRWRFFRAGDFDQVALDRGADFLNLGSLDQKLWVALACPTEGLEFDKKTLEFLDADHDGRIRAPELIAAAKWAASVLEDPDTLLEGTATIPLGSIDASTEEGKQLLDSAKEILRNLGKKGAKTISLEDTLDTEKIFEKTKFNGDGIVPVSSTDDEAVQKAIVDIMACLGEEKDRSGEPGTSQEKVDAFFKDAEALDAWWKKGEADPAVRPFGDATEGAAKAFHAVQAKIDDYFTRCRLAAFDPRAAGPMNRSEEAYAALGLGQLSATAEPLAELPLARMEPNKALPLEHGLNPAWISAMASFRSDVVKPLHGDKSALTDAEWAGLSAKLVAFDAWNAERPANAIDELGRARIRELLAGGATKKAIDELIAKDKALEPHFTAMTSVEKLLRYHRDLATFANNFVSFRDFYSGKKKAIFQAGTLYLDQRSCELCIKVADTGAHAALATLSGTYLVYLDCHRKGTVEKMTVAAAFSDGDSDNLMVGRNGIFYDREGKDWDACITKIVSHPISIREAFWLPYKRVAKLINDQIEKFASSRDKELHEKTAASVHETAKSAEDAHATAAAPAPAAPAPAAEAGPAPFDVARFAGIFAAIGLAIGAIGSMLAAVGSGFVSLRWWQMPLVLVGVMLLISGPSMIIAWLKLRQRNLGPILDASGWAVNARAKLNIPFGRSLTGVATLPEGAERSMDDPFAQKSKAWIFWLVLAVVLGGLVAGWRLGFLTKEMLLGVSKAPASPSSAPSAAPK